MENKNIEEKNKPENQTIEKQITDTDNSTQRFLNASDLTFSRSPAGTAQLVIKDEACHLRVVVRRLMPLSNPEQYISLAADEDTEIGVLVNPSQLSKDSLKILNEELDKRYFTPTIQKIYRVKEQFGIHEWNVKTERGRVTFMVRGLNQNIKQTPPARLFVTDVRGNRYDIPDYRKLDPKSFHQIKRHL